MRLTAFFALAAALGLSACGGETDAPVFHAEGRPAQLSDWGVLQVRGGRLDMADGVTPYDLNTPLFTDYAHKLRTIWMPEGVSATYREGEVLDFPVGTVITKTFYYPRGADGRVLQTDAMIGLSPGGLDLDAVQLIETRLLVRREAGWTALPYVWNEDQTEAMLARAGDVQRLELENAATGEAREFAYVVPNANQCAGCHATDNTSRAIEPIGPAPRHINRDYVYAEGEMNQLDRLALEGYLAGLPADRPRAVNAFNADAPLNDRARAWLDINCAHCHNSVGAADTSGLHLDAFAPLDANFGLCKPPIAAGGGTGGRRFSIMPGAPEESILLYRIGTDDPGAMMPELGRSLVFDDSVDLIAEWIASLEAHCPG